jgi:hypothetical protein
MKLILAENTDLEKEFEFSIFRKINNIPLVHNHISRANKIGLYLSGGPDSAALLCLIISELKLTNLIDKVPIHCFIVDKGEGQVDCAIDVVKEVERIYSISMTYEVIEHLPDEINPSRLGSRTYKLISDNNPDTIFYQGINNPPPEELKKFSVTWRGYGEKEVIYDRNKQLMCFPFLFLHKPQILDIFYKLNCESVIQYTQSCFILSKGICGNCFSCEERAWGFEMLKKQDPICL